MVVFKENQGVANPLNAGLELIEGEYYVALGSDDYFYTDRLNDFIDNDLNDKVDMVYFCLERNDGSLIEPNEETRALWVGSTKAYRREILGDTLYPDGKRACEDLVFDDLIRQKPHTYRFTGKIIKHYNFPREGSLTDLANKGKISEEFIGRCQGIFDAQVISAQLSDPEIVRALNGWVSRHTDKQIPEIISESFGEDTAILLVNALYLKNTWEIEFDPDNTMERGFTHEDGSLEFLDFLRHSDVRLPYLETDAARGVLLPYDDGRLSFFALMPREGAGFDEWLDSLDGAALARLLQSPEDTQFQSLVLPKFEKQWQGDLRAVLAGLGLDLAFDPTQADFSRLGDSPAGYFLSQAIHAARIEVNEEGTEAAAATVVVTDDAGDAPPPEGLILEFTRPFLYGIVDMVNGVPLFLGTFE